jgi:hypothetical protein
MTASRSARTGDIRKALHQKKTISGQFLAKHDNVRVYLCDIDGRFAMGSDCV